mmetsp:Transcript_19856/g.59104  ORF Transcript_19856/g.59104 Transcript_19856/m.59104 type:complete len:668 (-) Transcript_19856:42-2045(-)
MLPSAASRARLASRALPGGATRAAGTWSVEGVPTGSVATLHELGQAAGEAFGDLKSLGWRQDGEWRWRTYAERAERAEKLGGWLAQQGVEPGDRVAVISKNRAEFADTMYGAYAAGAAHVPMYEQQKPDEWKYILEDSEAKVLFVSRQELVEPAAEAAAKYGKRVLCFEDLSGGERDFEAAIASGAPAADVDAKATDLASLIYTSGTTGRPKGVELTHDNLLWNSLTMRDLMLQELTQIGHEVTRPMRSLAILPWAHIYGQTVELHAMLSAGHEVAIASDPTQFLAEVAEAKPQALFAVPALYNRIYDGFQANKASMSPFKQRLVDRALELGLKKAREPYSDPTGKHPAPPELTFGEKLQFAALDKLVLSKVRDKLGGEVVLCGNGGAAIATEVRNFVDACGIPMTNGYGLTETSPVLCKEAPHNLENFLPGSIGAPLPGVQLRVVDDELRNVPAGSPGELVASGRGVMRGYWRKPEATAEVLFEADGHTWFRTGDQCVLEPGSGHVRIVGRIKEQYKLANGKYVVPTPLEEQLARSRYIAQAFLYGDNRPCNVVLVTPDWVVLAEKFGKQCVMDAPFTFSPANVIDELFEDHADEIQQLMEAEVEAHSGKFKGFERPERVAVVKEGFNARRGMTTPKMSVKRPLVLKAHLDDIEALYAGVEEAMAA